MSGQTSVEFRQLLRHLWRGGEYGNFLKMWKQEGATRRAVYWKQLPLDALPTAATGVDVYFGVNPCAAIPPTNAKGEVVPDRFKRTQNAYVAAINCLFGDFDCKNESRADVLKKIAHFEPMASVIISSGGGWHAYWLLKEPFILTSDSERARAVKACRSWQQFTAGDNAVKDLARVLRVPGHHNYKAAYAPQYPLVYIDRFFPDYQYTLEELERAIPYTAIEPPALKSARPYYAKKDGEEAPQGEVGSVIKSVISEIESAAKGTRHNTVLRAAYTAGGYCEAGYGAVVEWERVLLAAVEGYGEDYAEFSAAALSAFEAGRGSALHPSTRARGIEGDG